MSAITETERPIRFRVTVDASYHMKDEDFVIIPELGDVRVSTGTAVFVPDKIVVNSHPVLVCLYVHPSVAKTPQDLDTVSIPIFSSPPEDQEGMAETTLAMHAQGYQGCMFKLPNFEYPEYRVARDLAGAAQVVPTNYAQITLDTLCAKRPSLREPLLQLRLLPL